jgi:hypothetical protein
MNQIRLCGWYGDSYFFNTSRSIFDSRLFGRFTG